MCAIAVCAVIRSSEACREDRHHPSIMTNQVDNRRFYRLVRMSKAGYERTCSFMQYYTTMHRVCMAVITCIEKASTPWNPQCRYEVTLATAGIQQVGWATLSCHFTTEEGVGDSYNSYAYDGKRRRKWNMSSSEYGERWAAGDVVGVGLDLDAREVRSRLPCLHSVLVVHSSSGKHT